MHRIHSHRKRDARSQQGYVGCHHGGIDDHRLAHWFNPYRFDGVDAFCAFCLGPPSFGVYACEQFDHFYHQRVCDDGVISYEYQVQRFCEVLACSSYPYAISCLCVRVQKRAQQLCGHSLVQRVWVQDQAPTQSRRRPQSQVSDGARKGQFRRFNRQSSQVGHSCRSPQNQVHLLRCTRQNHHHRHRRHHRPYPQS